MKTNDYKDVMMKINKQITQVFTRGIQLSVALIASTLLTTTVSAGPQTYIQGEGCDVEVSDENYELFFPQGSNVFSHTISRTDTDLYGGFGSSEGILICNAKTKPSIPYSCPNTGVEPDSATNYRMLMDTVNNTYCAYQYRVATTEEPVRSDIQVIQLEQPLPGAFPRTSVFQGYYKHIRDMDLYFPTGDWRLMANGRVYTFSVKIENEKLVVESSLGNIENIDWNKDTGEIKFTRKRDLGENQGNRRKLRQRFKGFLMTYADGKQAGSQRDYKWRMAGTYRQRSPRLDWNKRRSGWYATLPR